MSDKLKIRPSIKGSARAAGFIRDFCLNNDIDKSVAYKISLAADEILPNIIFLCTSPRIILSIERQFESQSEKNISKVCFTISHSGYNYDLSDKNNLVWPEQMEQSKITDLGLDIIHKYMDKIECSYVNGENITILTKYIK